MQQKQYDQGSFIDNFNLLVEEIVANGRSLTPSIALKELEQYATTLKLDKDGVCFGLCAKLIKMKLKGKRKEFFQYKECIGNLDDNQRKELIRKRQITYGNQVFVLSDLISFAADVLSYQRTQIKGQHRFLRLIDAKCINSNTFITTAKDLADDLIKNDLMKYDTF